MKENKKGTILLILKILKKNTNSKNKLKSKEISEILKREYGYDINERTVRNDLETLRNLGYDISTYEEDNEGYYYKDIVFSKKEYNEILNMIIGRENLGIEEKLNFFSKLNQIQPMLNIADENSETKKIKEILDAISKNKKIIILQKGSKILINPIDIIDRENRKYLIATIENYQEEYSIFQLSKIIKIERTGINRTKNKTLQTVENFKKNSKYIVTNEREEFEILFKKEILDEVNNKFGKSGFIEKEIESEYEYKLTIKRNIKDIKMFVLENINETKVINSPELILQLKEITEKIKSKYEI